MEIKEIAVEEFAETFPKVKLDAEFIRTAKTTLIVKLKNCKKFRPVFANHIGRYYLKAKKEIYF